MASFRIYQWGQASPHLRSLRSVGGPRQTFKFFDSCINLVSFVRSHDSTCIFWVPPAHQEVFKVEYIRRWIRPHFLFSTNSQSNGTPGMVGQRASPTRHRGGLPQQAGRDGNKGAASRLGGGSQGLGAQIRTKKAEGSGARLRNQWKGRLGFILFVYPFHLHLRAQGGHLHGSVSCWMRSLPCTLVLLWTSALNIPDPCSRQRPAGREERAWKRVAAGHRRETVQVDLCADVLCRP